MEEQKKKKNTFELILKIIIAVASAIAGAIGAAASVWKLKVNN